MRKTLQLCGPQKCDKTERYREHGWQSTQEQMLRSGISLFSQSRLGEDGQTAKKDEN